MDLDHLVDFYQWYVRTRPNRVYIPFHSWEYSFVGLAVLAAVVYHPILLAVVSAHLLHVATDHFHNRISPYGYFLTYRIINRFDAAVITPGTSSLYSYRIWPLLLPFGKKLRPWYQRRIEPWFEARVQLAIAAGVVAKDASTKNTEASHHSTHRVGKREHIG